MMKKVGHVDFHAVSTFYIAGHEIDDVEPRFRLHSREQKVRP